MHKFSFDKQLAHHHSIPNIDALTQFRHAPEDKKPDFLTQEEIGFWDMPFNGNF